MKYVKMLGLLAVAVAALMTFAGTASATWTDGSGKEVTSLHAEDESAIAVTGGSITINCAESTLGGTVKTPQGANHVATSGELTALTFSDCNHTVTIVRKGSLTATDTSTNTATVYWTGLEMTWLMHIFLLGTVHCTFVTNNTTLGTLTGSGHKDNTTTTATLDINAQIPKDPNTSHLNLCSETSTWEGSYVVTNPDHLIID